MYLSVYFHNPSKIDEIISDQLVNTIRTETFHPF